MAQDTPLQDSEPGSAADVPHLALKARLLLAFTVLLIAGAALYLLYARGAFEATQRLVLTTDNAEGVYVGMDLTFSGFPVGRVRKVELAASGDARLVVDVASSDAHWLRTSSVFTLERGLVGAPALRAFTGVLTDPALADGAERPVLRGDATAEIPRVVAAARELLENLTQITAPDTPLRGSLANVQAVTEKLKGPQGALGVLMGNEQDGRKLMATLDRTNALLARLDTVAGHADTQVFGPEGLVRDAKATVNQLNAVLADTRNSLKKLDAVLVEAQGVGANVKTATQDLGALRGEVEANLRKIDALVNEINRKWPFARDTEVRVP
jgi:phospholipid/cholesterol/gamma-HCH transport system substrate-binding protein